MNLNHVKTTSGAKEWNKKFWSKTHQTGKVDIEKMVLQHDV